MRFLFIAFFTLFSFSFFAQKRIKGKVLFENKPLANVAVYLNTTTVGTSTNDNGEFSLFVNTEKNELIISFLGFETINYPLDLKDYTKPLLFSLKEKTAVLDEIVIGDVKYDKKWYKNLENFKRGFLGESKFAKRCIIQNEKDLLFEYDKENNIFEAYAKKPLIIKNKSLGYKITIDLIEFKTSKYFMRYLGFSRFEELSGSARKQKKWMENRDKAYKGSFFHFLNCVVNNNVIEEGFIVRQFKRYKKTNKALEKGIDKLKTRKAKNALDSSYSATKKLKFVRNIDSIYNTNLSSLEIKSEKKGNTYLDFKDNLEVIYTKEKKEFNYSNAYTKEAKNTNDTINKRFQSSKIISLKNPSLINTNYRLANPLNVFFEGYWIFEKIAHSLPLDYKPRNSNQ